MIVNLSVNENVFKMDENPKKSIVLIYILFSLNDLFRITFEYQLQLS